MPTILENNPADLQHNILQICFFSRINSWLLTPGSWLLTPDSWLLAPGS